MQTHTHHTASCSTQQHPDSIPPPAPAAPSQHPQLPAPSITQPPSQHPASTSQHPQLSGAWDVTCIARVLPHRG